MLDPKLHTFMLLAHCKSTIECAELLHITQPAVTQHIKALERQYNTSFFIKEGRRLVLTAQGKRFEQLCRRLCTLDEQITREMNQIDRTTLTFGSTLSIADGLMPFVLPEMMNQFSEFQFHMQQQNTAALLEQLERGTLDFALIEGNFDHRRYTYHPFFTSRFVGLCSPNSPFADCHSLEQLLPSPLILRESGSGTRDIFESECQAHNLTIQDFSCIYEIAHMPTLFQLVACNKGITFAYEVAAARFIEQQKLQVINLQDFHLERPFHFVYLPTHPKSDLLELLSDCICKIANHPIEKKP